MSFGLAMRTFFRILRDASFAKQVEQLALPPTPPDPAIEWARLTAERLQVLTLLQRDGRLLDFLSENLGDYSDAQIGAAVRDIHRDCQGVLKKYLELGPVIDKDEDSPVDVPVGFNPSHIRLTGNVKGSPPHRGILAHRGWQAKSINLPEITPSSDPTILAPAEVELS